MNWPALLLGLAAVAGFAWVVVWILRRERAALDDFTGGTEREP